MVFAINYIIRIARGTNVKISEVEECLREDAETFREYLETECSRRHNGEHLKVREWIPVEILHHLVGHDVRRYSHLSPAHTQSQIGMGSILYSH